jgi:peptidyl-tRNA hydrolase, PTH1 family
VPTARTSRAESAPRTLVVKVILGLGNPGPEYDGTRHNVGWWMVDRLAHDWGIGPFRRVGPALVARGVVGGDEVELVKPLTYMNRSGRALAAYPDLDPAEDLLVVVDDATRDVGRVRFRPRGSPGGHNGLRSVSGALGTNEYPRLRIGVGSCPEGEDLAEWVLSPMPADDEDVVLELLPELVQGVRLWMDEGMEAAMDRYNR